MHLLRLLPLIPLLLAGCVVAPDEDAPSWVQWEPMGCDPSGATTIGRNAPPIDGLTGTGAAVARRVAQAFDDDLTSDTPADSTQNFARWSTSTGYVQVSRTEGSASWVLTTSRGGYPSEKNLEAALVSLGTPASSLKWQDHAEGLIQQVWQGHELSGTSASFLKGQGDPAPMGWYGSFSVGGLIVPPGPLATVADSEILATAADFDRCAMDAEGRTAAAGYNSISADLGAFAVDHESLVRQVYVHYTEPDEPGHCGFVRGVAVDAVTGAIHGHFLMPCR